MPPERYSGSKVVNFYPTPPIADIVDLGGGDYSLDVSEFGSDEGLEIELETGMQIVFSGSDLDDSGVAVNTSGELAIVGPGIGSAGPLSVKVGSNGNPGVCAIIVDGMLYARIALYDNSTPVDTCLALPLPISAIGDGDQNLPITIHDSYPNEWAGWQSALPAGGVVHLTGFNMPRTLTSYSGATPTTVNAEGGDYGIEFTIPQNCDNLAIFDDEFWLYIR